MYKQDRTRLLIALLILFITKSDASHIKSKKSAPKPSSLAAKSINSPNATPTIKEIMQFSNIWTGSEISTQ
jgi:hypothetical protein